MSALALATTHSTRIEKLTINQVESLLHALEEAGFSCVGVSRTDDGMFTVRLPEEASTWLEIAAE